MNTYGRKTRGLLPNLSIFQDEKDGSDKEKRSTTNKSIDRVPSRHGLLREDDSIDELASALLADASEDLRVSTSSQASPGKRSRSSPTHVLSRILSKPLPELPQNPPQSERNPSHGVNAVLTHKSTNMKAFSRNRQALKQSISNPIQHIIHADNDGRPQMARASEDAASSLNTTSDAAHLSRKISNLMYAANLETSERPARHEDDNTSRADSRTHRSRRGRNAFARAGKAIAQRFSNNTDKRSRKVLQESDVLCPSNIDPLVRKDETTNDTEHNRLSRRIAEGTNLGNPKIRSLTGDGNVPRKPLPVYESMKRLSQSDKSAEHRFSGSHLSYTGSSRHGSSNFDIDFNSRKSRPTSMQETLILHGLREDPRPPVPDLSPVEAEQPPRFSETISGLAQHPNVDFFSSSPEGSSTPRVRLERTYTPDGKKRLTALHSSAPSLLDFSFEDKNVGSSGDELAIPADTKLAKSQSVKRKTAKEDLRTVAARPSKKSKKTTITSPEEMVLASGIDKLDTHDPGALRSKDSNKKVSGVRREGSKGKGLGIFDTSKMKDSQSPPSAAAKKLRRRPSRRPSIPKRVSKISARDRRASGVLTPTSKNKEEGGDRDGTDVDDLQLDLSEYKVGTKDR